MRVPVRRKTAFFSEACGMGVLNASWEPRSPRLVKLVLCSTLSTRTDEYQKSNMSFRNNLGARIVVVRISLRRSNPMIPLRGVIGDHHVR